jgi:predicted DNA-binding protein
MSGSKKKTYSRLVINMPSDIKRQLRILAAMENQTMTAYIHSLIEKEVQLKSQENDRKRTKN